MWACGIDLMLFVIIRRVELLLFSNFHLLVMDGCGPGARLTCIHNRYSSVYFLISFLLTQRNLFEILLNQTEIILYLPFYDWFGTANGRVPLLFQINRKMVDTIWFQFDLIRFRKDFSLSIVPMLIILSVLYRALRNWYICTS